MQKKFIRIKTLRLQIQISYKLLSFPLKNDPAHSVAKSQDTGDEEKVLEATGKIEKSPTKKQE